MEFRRVDAARETCGKHLTDAAPGPAIDVILAQHVAAVAYSEFEASVRATVHRRCATTGDQPVAAFVEIAATRLIRSIKVEELTGILGWFGDETKEQFKSAMRDDPEAVAAWHNILIGRHGLAHEDESGDRTGTPSLTFNDVDRDIDRAKRVVVAFDSALST